MLDEMTDRGRHREARRADGVSPVTVVERSETGGSKAASSLGTSRTELPPLLKGHARALDDLREWRRIRYRRRQESADILVRWARLIAGLDPEDMSARAGENGWVRPPRPARCRWAVAAEVGVHHGESGAHWSGLERCASIWACPVCSSVIRAHRADEVQKAVQGWQAQGGSLVFVTLTLRHHRDDPLAVNLDAALKAWQRLLQGKSWQKFKARYGIRGYIRATEVTLGENGWHPHIHALFFVDQPLTPAEVKAWESEMFSRWAEYVTRYGAKLPTKLRGIDVRPADKDGTVVGQYLSKLQDTHGGKPQKIGTELTRFDTKGGRSGSIMPFELLDESTAADDLDDVARARLWVEFYKSTKGRRAITWSKGLRDLVMSDDEDELSDEEVLDEVQTGDLLIKIPVDVYRGRLMNQPDFAVAVLDAVERGNLVVALRLSGGSLVAYSETSEPPGS